MVNSFDLLSTVGHPGLLKITLVKKLIAEEEG